MILPKTVYGNRFLKEAGRRTKAVGAFPDGHSALMLVSLQDSSKNQKLRPSDNFVIECMTAPINFASRSIFHTPPGKK
jgi:transposase-like protein